MTTVDGFYPLMESWTRAEGTSGGEGQDGEGEMMSRRFTHGGRVDNEDTGGYVRGAEVGGAVSPLCCPGCGRSHVDCTGPESCAAYRGAELSAGSDAWYRAEARRNHAGAVEVYDDAVISRGDEAGAYVQAWVWVPFGEQDDDA